MTRLAKVGLEVGPTTTKVLAFGPKAQREAQRRGTKPAPFDFLGFTRYCGKNRKGTGFSINRKTSRKKFRAKLETLTQWLRANRMKYKTRKLWDMVCAMVRGHCAYYGVTDNIFAITRCAELAKKLLFKWLNRRGGHKPMTWDNLRVPYSFPVNSLVLL